MLLMLVFLISSYKSTNVFISAPQQVEYSCMQMARSVGIEVPDIDLMLVMDRSC